MRQLTRRHDGERGGREGGGVLDMTAQSQVDRIMLYQRVVLERVFRGRWAEQRRDDRQRRAVRPLVPRAIVAKNDGYCPYTSTVYVCGYRL
jgi:hypothetical protein